LFGFSYSLRFLSAARSPERTRKRESRRRREFPRYRAPTRFPVVVHRFQIVVRGAELAVALAQRVRPLGRWRDSPMPVLEKKTFGLPHRARREAPVVGPQLAQIGNGVAFDAAA